MHICKYTSYPHTSLKHSIDSVKSAENHCLPYPSELNNSYSLRYYWVLCETEFEGQKTNRRSKRDTIMCECEIIYGINHEIK